jgi:hypothetical protein
MNDFDEMDFFSDDEDKEKKAKEEKKQELKRKNKLNNIKRVLETPSGVSFFWDLLCDCGAFHSSFDENALKMSFREGRRSIGNELIADLMEACPAKYLEMIELQQQEIEENGG